MKLLYKIFKMESKVCVAELNQLGIDHQKQGEDPTNPTGPPRIARVFLRDGNATGVVFRFSVNK